MDLQSHEEKSFLILDLINLVGVVCCAWKKEKHYCSCINSLKYSKINITYYLLTYVFNYEIIWKRKEIRYSSKLVLADIFFCIQQMIKFLLFLYILAAWVHRGFTDDVTEITKIEPCGDLLTDFQKDKYRYFFLHVLDLNSDYVISAEDFVKLNEVSCLMRLIIFSRHCLTTLSTASWLKY